MAKFSIHAFLKGIVPISQGYGENIDYYASITKNPQTGVSGLQHGHEGVDFATPNGTEIFAPFDGIIVRDGIGDKDYGNFVVIWDPIQLCGIWFCHLQSAIVNISDKVAAGQLLGYTNNTGNTTGPHVHCNFVETDSNGYRINLDNGEEGFLNLMDESLVGILPMPGLLFTDPQTPTPTINPSPQVPEKPSSQDQTDQEKIAELTTQIEQLTGQRDQALQKASEIGTKYTTDLANYSAFVAAGYPTIDVLNKKLEGVEDENAGLKTEISQVEQKNAKLAGIIKDTSTSDSTAIDTGIEWEKRAKDLQQSFEAVAGAHGTAPDLVSILDAVDKIKASKGEVEQELKKLTVRQSINAAGVAVSRLIPANPGSKLSCDYLLNLFGFLQKKAVN